MESRYALLMDEEWMLGSEHQARVLDELFARMNMNAVESTSELVLVHAGAVVGRGGAGVLLPAAAGSGASACEVAFVIAHRYEPGAAIRVEPLSSAEACVELVRNLMLARRDTARSLDVLARTCRASQSYRLTHGDLDDAVAAIEDLTGPEPDHA